VRRLTYRTCDVDADRFSGRPAVSTSILSHHAVSHHRRPMPIDHAEHPVTLFGYYGHTRPLHESGKIVAAPFTGTFTAGPPRTARLDREKSHTDGEFGRPA